MRVGQWTVVVLTMTSALAGYVGLPACQGEGAADWSKVQPSVSRTCANCHDRNKLDKVVSDVGALDKAVFTEAAFPDAVFRKEVSAKSVADIIGAGEFPGDAAIPADSPKQKAWLLHDLHFLQKLLSEDNPPDYTSEAKFNAFVTAGKTGAWEGCEMAKKLDAGRRKEADGMPPLWAPKMFELLKVDFKNITESERQDIRDYVDALLPGGIKACGAGGESS